MTKLQKLAALLIILGPDTAAQVLKKLQPKELELVSAEVSRLPIITPELRTQILEELSDIAAGNSQETRGGLEFAQSALEKAVGPDKANDIIERVSTPRPVPPAMTQLSETDSRLLANALRDEPPQTIALFASYLTAEKGSSFLASLTPQLRDDVVERLATLGPAPVEVIEVIAAAVDQRITGKTSRGLAQTGGVKSVADILNALGKTTSKTILATLEEKNPELGQAVRQKMFIFCDLVRLETAALQKIMREVDMRDLALALKKADEVLKTKLLSGISKRAAETVREEMSFMGSVKLKDIEAAQLRVVEIVRRLENDGEIELEAEPAAA